MGGGEELVEMMRRPVWHGGQLMAFSGLDGVTDFSIALTMRTAFGVPRLEIKLPAMGLIKFLPGAGTVNRVTGDTFLLGTTVRGAFLDAYHFMIEGPCVVLDLDAALTSVVVGHRTLVGVASKFNPELIASDLDAVIRKSASWLQSQLLPAGVSPARGRTLLKAMSVMKTQVNSPEGRILHLWTTPDRWPHRKMWLWDSVFHAIGWRHLDHAVARQAIEAVLDMQAEDGFIAHMMDPKATSRYTQPPVLALGVKLVDGAHPVEGWIKSVYPKLSAYLEWDMANRDRDGGGLVEWEIEGDPFCRSGESGMDNSPRFDSATQMDAVDFNSFLALECEIMGEFAEGLGLQEDAARWKSRHRKLCQLITTRLWSDTKGFFVDYDNDRQCQSSVLASSGFLPLICGAATATQAEQLVKHLQDPDMFGTAFPIPSIPFCDRERYSKDMWRGPVWINLNWLIAHGLDRYGMHEQATALREKTTREIERTCEKYGVFFEFYDDRGETEPPELLRKGVCPEYGVAAHHQVFHDYGWTATLYVDLVYFSKNKCNKDTI